MTMQEHSKIKIKGGEQLVPNEVWLFKNFLSPEELIEIRNEIDNSTTPEDIYIESLSKYQSRIEGLIDGDFKISKNSPKRNSLSRIDTKHENHGMPPHVDLVGWINLVVDCFVPESFEGNKIRQEMAPYAFVIYFNDNYSGGEICYPEYNVEHKPKAGDLVIHSSEIIHAVKKVKQAKRYMHQGHIDELFWADKDKHDLVYLPKDSKDSVIYNSTEGDPLWMFYIDAPIIYNKRMAKFKETYIDQHLYS
ncbi:Oxoglutarate/iron-dependent dioxygenase [uncultured Caudovirales phage]|uniref:Oxoglutarate/iron-dependent dioxygenase n=1 Tax=uncultured Caudovirales phage TaxID=2100421 RepID=A0A6J5MG62_9CAUD|nr:Oxoglutarate/iron-dependent dioxygenase [uncultured Caudovirales phage]CAB4150917.1 Oxoglutarate/iron-dependent dioxygenase [uncultured Caudovirales phage]CAB4175023.1 Oxoglutarate/iron-dependent dioxygenase [uncultured Caudovirales phage]CAB4179620.1 Oxoglutarate/iron-dependent dioxygenase [uncultured Caudovirales phage]CAB4185689.1 Oxoglutarate/iron-dependent dioxygenase [uncultured Caudovirales phage]